MTAAPESAPYRVLARKYRPTDFAGLIGQEVLVRTLTNAVASGRVAHAFMLTGVRGVGKTTTARIIARALNCIGPDGTGGPTVEPCGVCEHCSAIAEDRHVDVIEMDAASRTGVDEIRDLIDGVRYRPVSARYKVYIVDEVHMLSKAAFNALLKTLEEPPEHVKFVFATTEIRKVPVTVLSRCQRFDLRRVPAERLSEHFRDVAASEGVAIEAGALATIARAADGSVRDGLSLLDQAMARGDGTITDAQVRDMLGLADRTAIFDLFERAMSGDIAAALDQFTAMYRDGADPVVVMQDLLDLTHWLTRVSIAPEVADAPGTPEAERERGRAMADALSIPALTRAWQMLLKGLGEVQYAAMPLQAAEMVLVRLAYASQLPSPAEIARELQADAGPSTPSPTDGAPVRPYPSRPPGSGSGGRGGGGNHTQASGGAAVTARRHPDPDEPAPPVPERETEALAESVASPGSFVELVALFASRREAMLHTHLCRNVHLVRFEPGRLEFRPDQHAPRDLANRIGALLGAWTGQRWVVSVSQEPGQPTLAQQAEAAKRREFEAVAEHPLVKAARQAFPSARITRVSQSPRAAELDADSLDDIADDEDDGAGEID